MEFLLEQASGPYGLAFVLIVGSNAALFWAAGIRLAPGALPDARRLFTMLRPAGDRLASFLNEQLRRRFTPSDDRHLPPLPPIGA